MSKDRFPKPKKDIKAFLSSEEGGINKKDIAKITTSLLALGMVLGGLMKPGTGSAVVSCGHTSHASHASHSSY